MEVFASTVLEKARARGLRIATAESCTGGQVAAALTAVPGASDVFERGFITYSNEAKTEMLGVPAELIAKHGAVSEEVARAMTEGALLHSPAELSVSVTGIAGPGGASAEKPVGLVHIAAARKGGDTFHQKRLFTGNRAEIQLKSVLEALSLLLEAAE